MQSVRQGSCRPPARPLLRAAASARGNLGPALRARGAGGGGTAAAPRRRGAGGTDPGLREAAPPGRTPDNALWGRRVGWGRRALQLELLPLVKNTPCPVLSLPIPRGALPSGTQTSPPRLALAPPRGQLRLLLICPLAQLARRLRREGRGDTASERDSLRRCPRDKGGQRGSGAGARGGGREGAEGGREGGGRRGRGRRAGGALFLVGPCPQLPPGKPAAGTAATPRTLLPQVRRCVAGPLLPKPGHCSRAEGLPLPRAL